MTRGENCYDERTAFNRNPGHDRGELRRGARATFYVAPSGDDGNSGAIESPLCTVQKAAEIARAGDTVLVRTGVYKGLVLLRFSGEPDKPIVFKNAPGERPVVDGEGRGRIELQSEQGWRKPIGWVTVEGFEVRNGWDGIKFYNAHHIVLKGNFIHDSANQGILGNGHHVRIEGNVIAHNGFKPDNEKSNLEHGIYATGTDFEIVNNVIRSNRAYGIQVAAYPFKPDSHAGPEFADRAFAGSSATTLSLFSRTGPGSSFGKRMRPTASLRTISSIATRSRSEAATARGSISSASAAGTSSGTTSSSARDGHRSPGKPANTPHRTTWRTRTRCS